MRWQPDPTVLRIASGAVLLIAVGCDRVAGLYGNRQQAPNKPSIQSGGSETTDGESSSSNVAAQDASSGLDSGSDARSEAESTPPLPTSCASSTWANCNGFDPCTSPWVPGGGLLMGRSDSGSDAFPTGSANEHPEHPVTISPFWLDKFEVTVGRFRQFVNSYSGNKPEQGAGAHPDILNSGWQSDWNDYLPGDATSLGNSMFLNDDKCNASFRTWTRAPGNNECLPVNCIDWYTAFAFCIWDGGRLPTEAEWEFAAAGGMENRLFPWGSDPPDNTRAVFNCSASASGECIPTDIRPIGSVSPKGDTIFGQADMAGSMMERTRDVFAPSFYTSGNATGNNVANLTDDPMATDSTTRGGNYLSSGDPLRAAARDDVYRTSRYDGVGFRCARGR